MPAETSACSSGRETAPQISTFTASALRRPARARTPVSLSGSRCRLCSTPASTSRRSRLRATSRTGETLPCHVGIATLISMDSKQKGDHRGEDEASAPQHLALESVMTWQARAATHWRVALCTCGPGAQLHIALVLVRQPRVRPSMSGSDMPSAFTFRKRVLGLIPSSSAAAVRLPP